MLLWCVVHFKDMAKQSSASEHFLTITSRNKLFCTGPGCHNSIFFLHNFNCCSHLNWVCRLNIHDLGLDYVVNIIVRSRFMDHRLGVGVQVGVLKMWRNTDPWWKNENTSQSNKEVWSNAMINKLSLLLLSLMGGKPRIPYWPTGICNWKFTITLWP